MVKLIVDYFYEDEKLTVIRKIYTGQDEAELIKRARENEHYNTCASVEYDIEYV
jgi:hypothetical protein